MLVPDRGEPTTKIGLFISLFIAAFDTWHVSARKLASVLSSRMVQAVKAIPAIRDANGEL